MKHPLFVSARHSIALLLLGFALQCACAFAQEAAPSGFIQIKGEAGLRVFLGSDFKGLTAAAEQGLILQNIPPGTYELRIAKDGFQPQTAQATVKANDVFVYEVKSFVPAIKVEQSGEITQQQIRAELGSLLIRTVPVDAVIEIPALGINAQNNGTKTRPDWTIRELPSGEYPATVKALNKEVRFTIHVKTGREAEYLVNVIRGETTDIGEQKQPEAAAREAAARERQKAAEAEKQSRFQSLLGQARQSIASKQWQTALIALADARELYPDDPALKTLTDSLTDSFPTISTDGRFLVSSENLILDTKTYLEWLVGPDRDTNYHDAVKWVDSCRVAGGGWRMPTGKELLELYQKGKGDRNMDPVFKQTGWWAWAEPRDSSSAWGVDFYAGPWRWKPRLLSFSGRAFAVRSRR